MSSTYHARKAKGLCVRCGGERDDERYNMCKRCRANGRNRYKRFMSSLPPRDLLAYKMKRSERASERLAQLHSEGKCTRCMGPSPDKWLCASCRQKIKDKRDAAKKGGSRDDAN